MNMNYFLSIIDLATKYGLKVKIKLWVNKKGGN
jgi:hypothetical protein